MITKQQLEAALKDAAPKLKKWSDLLELKAEEVLKDENYVEKYASARDEATKAGDEIKRLVSEYKMQNQLY
jgi:hypothetical protein